MQIVIPVKTGIQYQSMNCVPAFHKGIFLALFIILVTYLFILYNLYFLVTHLKKAIEFVDSFYPYDAFVFIVLQIFQVLIGGAISGEGSQFRRGLYLWPCLDNDLFCHRPQHWLMAGLYPRQNIRPAACKTSCKAIDYGKIRLFYGTSRAFHPLYAFPDSRFPKSCTLRKK